MSRKITRKRRPIIEALEPKLLFSAVADIALFDDSHDGNSLNHAATQIDLAHIYLGGHSDSTIENISAETNPHPGTDIIVDLVADPHATQIATVHNLVFVDKSVENYQTLVQDILNNPENSNVEIIYVDPQQSGIQQITDLLSRYSGVSSIHLISHGKAGTLELGNEMINSESVDNFYSQFAAWRNSLTADADILIYGCDLARDNDGLQLINKIAEFTQADVAASNNVTGDASSGGDWNLEVQYGAIEANTLINAGQFNNWHGTLVDTNYINTGAGYPFYTLSSSNVVGQSFAYDSPGATYNVNEISLYLARYGNAMVQTITVELRSSWNGPVLGSDTISSTAISGTGFEWHSFNFADVALNDNQTYYIQISTTGTDGTVLVSYRDSNVVTSGASIQNGNPHASSWDLAFKLANEDGSNAAPTVANPIADQSVNEESAFNFVVPINTFADADPNDTITYRAQLAGGGSLGWLTFNEITRTFSGTPHNHQVGTLHVELIGTDNHGASVSDFFDVVVNNINDDPTVANPQADRAITANHALNYTMPATTFNDVDAGAVLTYSAQLTGGGALPSWLTFNPTTRVFSGTPLDANAGVISIDVIADDGQGGTPATDTFTITVYAQSVVADQVLTTSGPSLLSTGVATALDAWQTFRSLGGTGTYDLDYVSVLLRTNPAAADQSPQTVTVSILDSFNGNVLASSSMSSTALGTNLTWQTFNTNNLALTYGQTYYLKISATGSSADPLVFAGIHNSNVYGGGQYLDTNGTAAPNRDLAFEMAADNSAPTVANPMSDQTATEDIFFNYIIPANTFNDVDHDTLVYTATLSNSAPLPAWLNFNPNLRSFAGLPDDGDVGTTLHILVTATDGQGLSVSDTFDLTVVNVNDIPRINVAIPNQNATEDSAFSYTFPANTFADDDVGATFTYSAQISGGGALPSWLTFNAATRTFSGTPLNANVGTLSIDVIADDGNGGTVSDTFDIVVANTNDAPTVANAIQNQNATEDTLFNFVVPLNTFNDQDVGDTLTYTAQLSGGGTLPSWLTFNAATRTFSGTPLNANVGTLSIEVVADDGNGGTVSETFDIVIANTNDAPTVANAIQNQNATEDAPFNFTVPLNTFNDQDVGDVLTYTAQLSGGGTLPSWLTFNTATRTFSGTPLNANVGTLSIDVIADDGNGGAVSDTFDIVIANTNDAPTVANAIQNQNATEDAPFNFTVPLNTFSDQDVGDALAYTAQLSGGGTLPSWLTFNAATRTFSGTPLNANVGTLSIDVIADDGNGGTVSDTFDIVVANTNDAPTVANAIQNQNAAEDTLFNFVVPLNTFNDQDVGDALTYTAQLSGGGTLPSWLTFNAATRTFSGTPLNVNVGTLSIEVVADDGNGGTVSDTFDIVVANTNDAPTVANAIQNQNATEDTLFNFVVPLNTFNDQDVGDTLTYTAQLSGGGALPSWLTFNAATRTFSGTPLNANVGTLSIEVIADDGNGGTISDTFDIVVANTNDAPTVANAIQNQNATEDTLFNFVVPLNTFNDQDVGDTLTYTAQLSGGGALPSWLTFNAATRTFSGMPLNANVGTLSIEVIADDGNGGAVSDTFDIVIANTNDAPTVANAIQNQNATEDTPFNFTVPLNIFSDQDVGDTLTYTTQLSGGSTLPSWLTFNAATRTFSGTPLNANVGTLSIDVIADDGNGGTVSDTFDIVIANTNDAPTVANAIQNQNATEDTLFNFVVPLNTFSDQDVGDTLTYTAQLSGGGTLPSWLTFNAATRTFSGTPLNANVGTLSIDVIADDGNGGAVSNTFDIVVANTNDAPTVANAIQNQNATEDTLFNFVVPLNTFNDQDVGDTLTYTAQLSGGGTLPSWLTFNAATRTFSGTPLNANVGTLSIDVVVSDGNGGVVGSSFNLIIANTNDAPFVSHPIQNQFPIINKTFLFTLPDNTFTDVDVGDSLHYSAMLANGEALPSWLHFNNDTNTFSGVPSAADLGKNISIIVRAVDSQDAAAEATFQLTITDSTPAVTKPLPPTNNGSEVLPEITPPKNTVETSPGKTQNDNAVVEQPIKNNDSEIIIPPNASTNNPLVIGNDNINFVDHEDINKRSLIERLSAGSVASQQSITSANTSSLLASLIAPDNGFDSQDIETFNQDLKNFREQMNHALEKEQQQRAVFAGVTLSVTTGILVWSLRASSLLFTLMSMLPLWRGIDPLPILDEVNKRKKELEEQRKDKQREDKNAKEVGYLFDRNDSTQSRK